MGTMTARQPSSHRLNQVIILPMYTVKFGASKMCCKMVAVSTKLQNLPNLITLVPPHGNVQLVVAILNPVTFYIF